MQIQEQKPNVPVELMLRDVRELIGQWSDKVTHGAILWKPSQFRYWKEIFDIFFQEQKQLLEKKKSIKEMFPAFDCMGRENGPW